MSCAFLRPVLVGLFGFLLHGAALVAAPPDFTDKGFGGESGGLIAAAREVTIHLDDGKALTGTIESVADKTVTVRNSRLKIAVPRSRIVKVEAIRPKDLEGDRHKADRPGPGPGRRGVEGPGRESGLSRLKILERSWFDVRGTGQDIAERYRFPLGDRYYRSVEKLGSIDRRIDEIMSRPEIASLRYTAPAAGADVDVALAELERAVHEYHEIKQDVNQYLRGRRRVFNLRRESRLADREKSNLLAGRRRRQANARVAASSGHAGDRGIGFFGVGGSSLGGVGGGRDSHQTGNRLRNPANIQSRRLVTNGPLNIRTPRTALVDFR